MKERNYADSEVICEGLRLLEEEKLAEEAKLNALKQSIQESLESGAPTPLDMNDVIKRGRKRRTQ